MKKKGLVLLGTILSSVALIGGTLAAYWAVTDNANEIEVTITPGEIETITATKSVTLEWGESQLVDIQNLKNNTTKGPYKVQVKATTSDNGGYTGALKAKLESTTLTGTKLIDSLTINVYEAITNTNQPSGSAILTLNGSGAAKEEEASTTVVKKASEDIAVTNATAKDLYVFVTLANLSEETFNTVKSQTVTLGLDWGYGSETTPVSSRPIYYDNQNSWSNVYLYAYKSTDGTNNGWPGIKMSEAKENSGIFSASLDVTDGFDTVIFNNGSNGEGNQTGNITLDASISNCYYHCESNTWSWTTAPDLSAETVYYLVGEHNQWTTGTSALMTKGTYNVTISAASVDFTYKITNVTIGAGQKVKVVSSTNKWYGEAGTTDGDMTIGAPGAYNFYFNPSPTGSNPYIFCEQYTA